MRILSWNVNGIDEEVKHNLEEIIEKYQPNVLCLQLTKLSSTNNHIELENYTSYYHDGEKAQYGGTVIFCRNEPLQVIKGIPNSVIDNEGRVITVEYSCMNIVSVYVPNIKPDKSRTYYRCDFDHEIVQYYQELMKDKMVLICGDFNVVRSLKDTYQVTLENVPSQTMLEQRGFIKILTTGFIDVYRHLHPDKEEYTFWSTKEDRKANNHGSRTDYMLITEDEIELCTEMMILSDITGSNHAPILLDIDI